MTRRAAIAIRQRDTESSRLFRAFASEYRTAKRYRAFRFGLSTLIMVAGMVLGLLSLTADSAFGIVPGLWMAMARLIVIPAEIRHVRCGVRIQECFDVRLFDLPWPRSLAGAHPSDEDIADSARQSLDDKRLRRQLDEGWYPATDELPWPMNVLESQRTGVAYGRRLHAAYAAFLAACIGVAFLAAIAIGVATQMSLVAWLSIFVWPSPPIVLDVVELALSHRKMTYRKQAIESSIEDFWQGELADGNTLTVDDCRGIQDEVFKLRISNAQIPEWFHWKHRSRSEANMREASAARLEQYRQATHES